MHSVMCHSCSPQLVVSQFLSSALYKESVPVLHTLSWVTIMSQCLSSTTCYESPSLSSTLFNISQSLSSPLYHEPVPDFHTLSWVSSCPPPLSFMSQPLSSKLYYLSVLSSTLYHEPVPILHMLSLVCLSDVSDNTDSESALCDTFGISAVSDNTDISFQRYVFTWWFLLWSNQRCRIQRWSGLSAVSNNADSELVLYLTALIRNQRCIWQHWFGISAVSEALIHKFLP